MALYIHAKAKSHTPMLSVSTKKTTLTWEPCSRIRRKDAEQDKSDRNSQRLDRQRVEHIGGVVKQVMQHWGPFRFDRLHGNSGERGPVAA